MVKGNRMLSLKQKLEIIKAVVGGCDRKDVAKTYNCTVTTISRIMKNKEVFLRTAEYGDLHRKRERKSIHFKLEEALCEWFKEQKDLKTVDSISTSDLLKKAKELANVVEKGFEPSRLWIVRWKNRNGNKIARRDNVVNEASVDSSSCMMVEICKAEYFGGDEAITCLADSTSKQINQVDNAQTNNSLLTQVDTSSAVQENTEATNAPVADYETETEPVNTKNSAQECIEEPNAPSISAALQALLVVKQFFILNDLEISSLFNIEEKILQHWKKNI